jgi:hypothetical protein
MFEGDWIKIENSAAAPPNTGIADKPDLTAV